MSETNNVNDFYLIYIIFSRSKIHCRHYCLFLKLNSKIVSVFLIFAFSYEAVQVRFFKFYNKITL
jgi:hypothetical protein